MNCPKCLARLWYRQENEYETEDHYICENCGAIYTSDWVDENLREKGCTVCKS